MVKFVLCNPTVCKVHANLVSFRNCKNETRTHGIYTSKASYNLERGFYSIEIGKINLNRKYFCSQSRNLESVKCKAGGGFGSLLKDKKEQKTRKCPCGGGEEKLQYEECCKKFHDGEIAADPVILMQSRYSAYALKKAEYVMATTHPDNPACKGSHLPNGKVVSTFKQDVMATCKKVKFIKLEVEGMEDGSTNDEAFVTFRAHVQVIGQNGFRSSNFDTEIMKEKSRFLKSEDGKWLYVDGNVTYVDE